MKIASTQFNLKNRALEIYISGCDGKCIDCHNLELMDYNIGKDFRKALPEIKKKIENFSLIVKSIWILGGEPLLQELEELEEFLSELNELNKKMYLFTRFEIEDVPDSIVSICDYVKIGEFEKSKLCEDNVQEGIKLASSNQKIYRAGEYLENIDHVLNLARNI